VPTNFIESTGNLSVSNSAVLNLESHLFIRN